MAKSVLLGLPPITHDNKLIYNALAETSPLLLKMNPAPPGTPHEDKAPRMIIRTSIVLALAVIIDYTRLWVRRYRIYVFGPNDIVILPAAIGCVLYLSINIITDWFLLPVPLIIIWRLQIPLSWKIRLIFVFCMSFISSIASIIRNILSGRIGGDVTWDYYNVYAWDVVDIFFATIVASLPALNSLVDQGISSLKTCSLSSTGYLLNKTRSLTDTYGNERLSDKDPRDGLSDIAVQQKGSSSLDRYDEPWTCRPSDVELQTSMYHD